jgi:hypothetical protein
MWRRARESESADADAEHHGEVGPVGHLRSGYYAFCLALSERLARERPAAPEVAAGDLGPLPAGVERRIADLLPVLEVPFEARLARDTALANYATLEWLVRLYRAAGRAPPRAGVVHDVGCASFWYAAALDAWFAPRELVGVELDGHRRLKGGLSRAQRALGYLAAIPTGRFVVASYADVSAPARVVTAFFPFVTPRPVLAWRLPLGVLAPVPLFARIRANLAADGEFVMANHGVSEAARAAGFAAGAGLVPLARVVDADPLVARTQPAVITLWRRE